MDKQNGLDNVSTEVIQKIYQCLFQAVGEDYQEAENHLNLETHVSKPFMIWDLIYRNLIHIFSGSNVLYSTKKRGMWEVMLLYDKGSKMLLSFMKDTRFKTIRNVKPGQRPQYINAVLTLNSNLQAEQKQQKLFVDEEINDCSEFKTLLDELCMNFLEPVVGEIQHHALIVFSTDYGQITSLTAYVLDKDLDVVSERDWLDCARPIMSNTVEKATEEDISHKQPVLTEKAKKRIKQKELVGLKSNEEEKHTLS